MAGRRIDYAYDYEYDVGRGGIVIGGPDGRVRAFGEWEMTEAAKESTAEDLIPELAAYKRQFEGVRDGFGALSAGLTDDQFNWRPEAEEWSMAECIDHLVVIGHAMLQKIDEGIEQARERGLRNDGPFTYGAIGNWFVKAVGPQREGKKRKFKAPKLYTPTSNHSISRLQSAFTELQRDYIERLHAANGYDLARIKVTSPVTRLMRFSLGQWFALLAGHQERHFDQARDVRARMEAKSA